MDENIKIIEVNSNNFETQQYGWEDENLIIKRSLDTEFNGGEDYIEYFIYDETQELIYPNITTPLTSYTIKNGDILLNPSQDISNYNLNIGSYYIKYNFYKKRLNSSIDKNLFITEINSDRTELRLDSFDIDKDELIRSTKDFINYRENSSYFVDFKLNFGSNSLVLANNIKLDDENPKGIILIKLPYSLPEEFDLKFKLWVVEEISQPQTYKIILPEPEPFIEKATYISGPNFNINIKNENAESSKEVSYSDLIESGINSSQQQIKSLLNNKGINVNINYEDFSNFIHFSSAKTRLENFLYKISLIENYNEKINDLSTLIIGETLNSSEYNSNLVSLTSEVDLIIKNFDEYEYFLYYNSGSLKSYPKFTSTSPYELYPLNSNEVQTWIGSLDENDPYYGGIILEAYEYDINNKDWLYNTIPEYLIEDPENKNYELFLDMIGQHFDNIWIYIKDFSNRFSMDNRLDYGISKDLVADAIKDFGVKLYSNNYNKNDLFLSFIGSKKDGGLFPYLNYTESLPAEPGDEYINNVISSTNESIALDDINKRIYKRIYHNLPYLLKTKGTINSIRALITSFGIPNTILRINEFGSKDKINSGDWDLKQNHFNYKLNTLGGDYFKSSFELNSNFNSPNNKPQTIIFRFQTNGKPNYEKQVLWVGEEGTTERSALILEYNESVDSPYYEYGTLKYIPNLSTPAIYNELYLPFFNSEWWGIMINMDLLNNESKLTAGNTIKDDLGFFLSDSRQDFSINNYNNIDTSNLGFGSNLIIGVNTYSPFKGYLQEIRYYNSVLNENTFKDFILNPYSIEGNSINSSPDELCFRADLGTMLDLNNRSSIHPKITGSLSFITQSFDTGDSNFTLTTGDFISNIETISYDQPPIGIRNPITDKIQILNNTLPEQTSGSNPDIEFLSHLRRIEQLTQENKRYTNNIKYLEVAFSPQDEINQDIMSQLGYFNIGDYIGDPRQLESKERSYPDLDKLRNQYFEKYIKSYDVFDFIRLIKFFDNSLFKMIKDFTPANTSLSSGIVIKQHILERNRHKIAQVSFEDETYEGLVKPQSRNYNTGSGDSGFYSDSDSSTIYVNKGGTGGGFENYNGIETSKWASERNLGNIYNLTQSFEETWDGPLGPRIVEINNQEEFYDGEFSGSKIQVSDGVLNKNCRVYLKPGDDEIFFNPIFFSSTTGILYNGTVSLGDWVKRENSPLDGDIWVISEYDSVRLKPIVKYIKIPNRDINGLEVKEFVGDLDSIKILFPERTNSVEYEIIGYEIYQGNITLTIGNINGDFDFYKSVSGGSENWSLKAEGSYTQGGIIDVTSQNLFLDPSKSKQQQFIRVWDGIIEDNLGFFTPGIIPIDGNSSIYDGTYNIKRTPNIPLIISCSLEYTASDLGFSGTLESQGIFHSASNYSGFGLENQNFTLSLTNTSGVYIPSPKFIDLDENLFYTSYDWSKRGDRYLGHPRIKVAGTASLDFYFPSLTLGGTPPVLTPEPIYTPLSASNLVPTNGDFDYSPSLFISDIDPTETGTISISVESIKGQAEVNDSKNLRELPISSTLDYLAIIVNYSIDANQGLNFTSSFWVDYDSNLSNFDINNSLKSEGNGLGTWQKVNTPILPSFDLSAQSNIFMRMGIKSPESSDFNYTFNSFSLKAQTLMTYELSDGRFVTIDGPEFPILGFGEQEGLNTFTPQYSDIPTYNKVNIKANLYYTGSDGNRLLVSSNELIEEDIYPGKEFIFPDSPILGINDPNPISPTTTTNLEDSWYYVEYSMSNFIRGTISNTTEPVSFIEGGDLNTKLIINQSVEGLSTDFYLTGSFNIHKNNNIISNEKFIIPTSTSNGIAQLELEIKDGFKYDDLYAFSISCDKNYGTGLSITEYSMSIYPSSSIYSEILPPFELNNYKSPTSTLVFIPTYYEGGVLPFRYALNCQPLLNNYSNQRLNNYLMKVDYNNIKGSIIPSNLERILNNEADKAETPDSNYTQTSNINSKYNGSKTSSYKINVWSPKDINTYGKLPVIESRNAYFGYFNLIKDPYPNINDNINLNLTYLIDEMGNAIPPSLEGIGYYNLIKTFPEGDYVSISIDSGSKELKELNESYPTLKVGKYVSPIMYTQTSSRGYSSTIPLTGSRRISRYDNEADAFSNFAFISEGSGLITALGTDLTTIDTIIGPITNVNIGEASTASYQTTNPNKGEIHFPIDANSLTPGLGNQLSDEQFLTIETKVETSYLYASGKIELELKLILEKSGSLTDNKYITIPPTIEDLILTLVKNNGDKIEVGSVISGNNDIVRFVTNKTKSKKFFGLGKNYKNGTLNKKDNRVGSQSPVVNSNNEIEMVFENYALNNLLKQKGLYNKKKGGVNEGGQIKSLQWTIKANSGQNQLLQGDRVRWKLVGKTEEGKDYPNYIFPSDGLDFLNPLSTKLTLRGSKSHLLGTDNQGNAPFWVFEGLTAGGTSITNKNTLIMSSSNINEAYGSDFYQGELEYIPGPSEYFPGGIEPEGTQFDRITFPLTIRIGDEIRFINNENYTYKIKGVIAPQDNIESDNIGRLKIILNGEVPDNINKDFFLIRRYVDNANSVLIDTSFPYSNPPSPSTSTGILFPEFPVITLQNNASNIISDLVGKGIIK